MQTLDLSTFVDLQAMRDTRIPLVMHALSETFIDEMMIDPENEGWVYPVSTDSDGKVSSGYVIFIERDNTALLLIDRHSYRVPESYIDLLECRLAEFINNA